MVAETKPRSIPQHIAHFHLYREERNTKSGKVQRFGLGAFLPADFGKYAFQPHTVYYVNYCGGNNCIPEPEPPRESTLDMLKPTVDQIAEQINQHGADCFDSDTEPRNARVWQKAHDDDSEFYFNPNTQVAECLACAVEIDLSDDYSESLSESAASCEHLAEVLTRVDALRDTYMETYGITWTADHEGDVIGVRLMVAGGGPNIFINTVTNKVEGYWAFTEYSSAIRYEQAQAITEHFKELAPFSKH